MILSQVPPYPSVAFDRYFQGLDLTAKGGHGLLSLEFAITNRCKFNCWHCSNVHRQGKDLTLEELSKAITEFIDHGVTWVGLSGGEPLLRKDIVDIVRNIGPRATAAILTTGYDLTKKTAKALRSAGLFSFIISLDSIEKAKHDKLRGFSGAYKVALNAIKMSLKYGFYTVVSTVATHSNVTSGELETRVKF